MNQVYTAGKFYNANKTSLKIEEIENKINSGSSGNADIDIAALKQRIKDLEDLNLKQRVQNLEATDFTVDNNDSTTYPDIF